MAARWNGAGSIDAFVAKMNSRAAALKMTHTHFADPAGASPQSVSTPSDLLVLGMAAMKDPAFASIVAMPQVDLPVAGTVYNVNGVLGQSGIVGIKTGSGLNTGANFLFASTQSVDNHDILVMGCVMGQPTLDIAFAAAKALIAAMSPALHVRRVIARNQSVAHYTTPWGAETDLVSQVDVDLGEWPGLVLRRHGDEGAFVELTSRLHGPMLRLAMAYVGDHHVAEDVVQEAWLTAIRSVDRFEGRSSLKTWISGIVINLARARRRKESRLVTFTALLRREDPDRREPTVDP